MTVWLTNPPRKKAKAKRTTKRKPPKGFRTWAAYMASIRPGSKKKRKTAARKKTTRRKTSAAAPRRKKSTARGASRRKATTRRATVARKRKSTTRRRTTRRRSSYRRNPAKNMVKTLTEGVQHAAAAVVGKAAARAIPAQLGLPSAGAVGIATQAAVAIGVGLIAEKVHKGSAPFVVTGALMAPIEGIIAGMNIPVLSPALSAYPELQAYPLAALPYEGANSEAQVWDEEYSVQQ